MTCERCSCAESSGIQCAKVLVPDVRASNGIIQVDGAYNLKVIKGPCPCPCPREFPAAWESATIDSSALTIVFKLGYLLQFSLKMPS